MRRYLAYLAFILLLAPLESTLPRLPWLHGVHALLLVPLVGFFALRLNTIEGVVLAFVAGTVEDATVAYSTGLAAFTLVALFVAARLALAAVRLDGWLFEALYAFVLAAGFFTITQVLRRAFEKGLTPLGEGWVWSYVVPCVVTAVATPLVMHVARKIETLQAKTPGAL